MKTLTRVMTSTRGTKIKSYQITDEVLAELRDRVNTGRGADYAYVLQNPRFVNQVEDIAEVPEAEADAVLTIDRTDPIHRTYTLTEA